MAVFLFGVGVVLFGRSSVTVNARGIVRPKDGLLLVRAQKSGYVQSIVTAEGRSADGGTVLVRLIDPALEQAITRLRQRLESQRTRPRERMAPNATAADVSGTGPGADEALQSELEQLEDRTALLRVTCPIRATLAHLHVHRGEYVQEGAPIAALIPADSRLVAYLAVPEKERPRLRVGVPARIKLDAFPYQEDGLASGRVARIGNDLLSEDWREQFTSLSGGPLPPSVLIELEIDRAPPLAKGPVQNGMLLTAELVIGTRPIASLLL